MKQTGTQIILCNAFHLWLRPEQDVIKLHGDLHHFMHWYGPIITDSGGIQIFSMGNINKITEAGVYFRHLFNGTTIFLSPEKSMEIQSDLGSDIVMVLDECTSYPVPWDEAKQSIVMYLCWSKHSYQYFHQLKIKIHDLVLFKIECTKIYEIYLRKTS